MAKYTNLLTIEQGASWVFNMSVLDDETFRTDLIDYLTNSDINFPSANFLQGLTDLINSTTKKDILQTALPSLLIDIATADHLTAINDIFNSQVVLDLSTKTLTVYFKIVTREGSTKTININTSGVIQEDNSVTFTLTPEITQTMVDVRNKNLKETIQGFYTVEMTDTATTLVTRVLEGDVIVTRTAK